MSARRDSRVAIRTPEYYRRLAAYEAADPWARTMADWSEQLIRQYAQQTTEATWLDVGCGAGGFLGRTQASRRIGLDVDSTALETAAQQTSAALAQAAAEALPVASETVDVVTSHDVLQHAPAASLAEAIRVLRPGGLLVLRTATRRGLLWGKHVDSHDYRQWTPAELQGICRESNVEILFLARVNALPSLIRDLAALVRGERPSGDAGLPPTPQDPDWKQTLLRAYWRVERACLWAGLRPPWGHSLLLAARK